MSESRLRIIIIDDNPSIHNDFRKILTMNAPSEKLDALKAQLFGNSSPTTLSLPVFEIDTATQGKEGFEKIVNAMHEKKPYALAFVDIRMPPGWDGVETIKHIWEKDPEIQIVICTAHSDYTWEQTVEELGQKENLLILKKPFDQIAVRQLAVALTRKWQLQQETKEYTETLEKHVRDRTRLLEHQATHDALTGLANRSLFAKRVQEEIAKADANQKLFAVLFFDIDRFKLINDSFSHAAGDQLLKSISDRIRPVIRENDTFARLGGDEFVLIVSSIDDANQIRELSEKILDVFKKPFQIAGREFIISTSIGISVYPKDGKGFDILLQNADIAMYRSKELGGNQYYFYTPSMSQTNMLRLEIESDLHRALDNKELFICYQPQYDLKNKKLLSVEALVRWNHPEKGVLLPIEFIPIAEEAGLVTMINEWVLKTACHQTKIWQNQGLPLIRIAVNIAAQQFKQPDFISRIKNILKESQLEPKFLELELTENILLSTAESTTKVVQLKKLGVHISLDDFGTGFSSLTHLRNIPLDRLKIDKSFVKNIHLNKDDEVIIQAIITMAKSLNLEVVAEGVETQRQLDFLESKNCDEIQGYYFSKPLSTTELENLLKNPSPPLIAPL